MRLLGKKKLNLLRNRSVQSEKWMCSWVAEILAAQWKQPSDVQDQFPNARHEGGGVFIFPVASDSWVVASLIAFPQGVVLITDLKGKDETH